MEPGPNRGFVVLAGIARFHDIVIAVAEGPFDKSHPTWCIVKGTCVGMLIQFYTFILKSLYQQPVMVVKCLSLWVEVSGDP